MDLHALGQYMSLNTRMSRYHVVGLDRGVNSIVEHLYSLNNAIIESTAAIRTEVSHLVLTI